jgi:hypothetical protein
MNSDRRIHFKTMALLSMLIVSGLIVSACGGESGGGSSQSSGIGGTGINVGKGVVQGRVTGFGSIYVNGNRYNIDTSVFIVDGSKFVGQAGQAELALGMVVQLGVETEDGVFTDKALDVVYDDEVQGPVSATPTDVAGSSGTQKTFMVFGQTVTIDETETEFEDTSFATLDKNDVVEISGFRSSPNDIVASYVEWQGDMPNGSEVELRGIVSGYKPPPTREFMLDGFLITFDSDPEIEAILVDGLYVEVEGLYKVGLPDSVHADEIEEEDEGFDDDVDDVSLEGPISEYSSIASFKINGQQIDASQASLLPVNAEALLGNGVEVEVEGNIVGGVLMAEELEVEEVETNLKAFVMTTFSFPDNKRFLISYTGLTGSIEIVTNSETEYDDQSPVPAENFSVVDLIVGDFVVIEGVESAGKVIAGSIERQDPANLDDSELDGQVDSFVANTSITVLGIPFMVDDGTFTKYKDGSGEIFAVDFFDKLKMGDRVEIRDQVPVADGFAEEVKLDD